MHPPTCRVKAWYRSLRGGQKISEMRFTIIITNIRRCIITEKYKLAHFYYDVDEWELYDRKKDINEMKSVYDDPAYAEVVKDLKKRLADLRVKYQDNEELDKLYIQKTLDANKK